METVRSEAFFSLKPFCVQLTKDHSRTNIASLFAALQSVDVRVLQDLQEYVIFPLRVILMHPQKCSQDLYLDLFTCMEFVLGHTSITKWDLFYDIFNRSTCMLSCPTDQSKVAKLSEELKIAIIQTLRTLVKNSEHSIVQRLYTVICLPLLGHSVSLLLNIAEVERARNLRILAMECLLDLSQADSKYSICLKADIGGLYASFLPGISVALCKIITGDTKQGYAVISKAIYVWMRIVSLVMDDKLLETHRKKKEKQEKPQKEDIDPRLHGLIAVRDSTWIASTAGNLAILAKQLTNVTTHPNWRVRLVLVECAEHLLLHCTRSMKVCVPTFLEILVSLIGDDYSKVASGSRHALDLFSQTKPSDQQKHLTEILAENFLKLTVALPRRIQTAEESDKLSLLSLLSGYLSLLGSRVKSLMLSMPHLGRLSRALVQVLELDCSDIRIIEEQTTLSLQGSMTGAKQHNVLRPRKYFKHFNNDKIFQSVCGLCHLLGYYGDIHLLVDYFLDMCQESSLFKPQAVLIINELMLGTTGETVCVDTTKNGSSWHQHSKDELDTVVRMLVDVYLNPTNFDLPTSVRASNEQGRCLEQRFTVGASASNNSQSLEITAARLNRNVLQIALYLEGLGNFAKVLKFDFSPFLMSVLYPVLEKLGDETAYISNAAFITLWDICDACNYRTLDELICGNADYLMNAISLKLRNFHLNRRCPLVLKVMLQHSSASLLPLIDDTIKEILKSLDDNYEDDAVMFMGVLKELARAVVRWFPDCDDLNKSEASITARDTAEEKAPNHEDKSTLQTAENTNIVKKNGKVTSEGATCVSDPICNNGVKSNTDVQLEADIREAKKLTEYFSNLLKLEREAKGEITDEEMDNFRPDLSESATEAADISDDLDIKKPPLPQVVAVKEVMIRCKHLLASKNPRLRLLVLDTLQHSLMALKPHQEELLPMIHQVWSAFSLTFTDEEKLVTVKALDVLMTVTRVARDFMRHRVAKDVLPKLSNFLLSQAEISIYAGSAYQFTVNYKLQKTILDSVGDIVKMSCIQGNDLDLLTSSCVPYLHGKQPVPLQNACMGCCKRLIELDPDLLWLKLVALYCPEQYQPPDDRFAVIKALTKTSANNHYTANVSRLMQETGLSQSQVASA